MRGAGERSGAEGEARVARGVFALLLVSYAFFFQGGGWNPNSRLDLTRAVVERGSLSIDAYRHNTGDWAAREGRFYTNKAPGLSLAAAPFYGALQPIVALLADEPRNRLLVSGYLSNLAVNALPSACLGWLIFHVLGSLGLGGVLARAASALAFGLGTPAFPYATAFYAHQPAAAASFAAFAGLLAARRGPGRTGPAVAAGAAAGAAVCLEHSALLTLLLLLAAFLLDRSGRRLLLPFAAGGLPLALALAAYNTAAFGSPLSAGFAHANPDIEVRVGGALFGAPTAERIHGLLVSFYRGLLPLSPLFLLAPFGWPALFRRDRRVALFCLAVPLAFLLLVSSFHAWHGGFAVGPRYLIPALPFLFVPTAFALWRLPALGASLVGLSVALAFAVSLVGVEIAPTERDPLRGVVLPVLLEGRVSLNTYGLDDYSPREPRPEDMSSFNLGELAWPATPLSALPLLLLWIALGAPLLLRARALDAAAAGRGG